MRATHTHRLGENYTFIVNMELETTLLKVSTAHAQHVHDLHPTALTRISNTNNFRTRLFVRQHHPYRGLISSGGMHLTIAGAKSSHARSAEPLVWRHFR